MSASKLHRILLIFSVIFISACSNSKPVWEYLADNPLEADIIIKIDDKEYTIPAKSSLPIGITQGKHTLTYKGNSVNFVTKVNSNKSVTIMNPTLSNYMLHANFYVMENVQDKSVDNIYDENSVEYQANSGIVKLPVQVLNTLFLEKAHTPWMFGLDENAKDQISVSYAHKQNVIRKLYREQDYKKEFAGELPEGIIFPTNTKRLSEQPAYTFPAQSLECDCNAANNYMKELESSWQSIISNPDNIYQDLAKLYSETSRQQTASSELKKQCGSRFNPGLDDKAFSEALSRMSEEMKYLSDASSFIVK